MNSLAEILGWKFDNAPGIRTGEKRDADGNPIGEMEITGWPDALGVMPNAGDIAAWTAEYFTAVGKAEAMAEIDSRAEAARAQWITPGSGQALAYEAKRREAEAWAAEIAAAATPDHAAYPWMLARAARLNGVTEASVTLAQMQAVADEWATRAAAWEAAGIAIEDIREAAKEDIAAAPDEAAIAAVLAGLAWPAPA